jgi:hypothetical protein
MIDKSFIQKIEEMATKPEDRVFEAKNGEEYWVGSGNPVIPVREPVKPVATVFSLSALVSAFDSPELKSQERELQVVVESHKRVVVETAPDYEMLSPSRDVHLVAEWNVEGFPFGKYIGVEEFIVGVQCGFMDDSDEKAELLSFTSRICDETSVTRDDDGVSQHVVTQSGRKANAKAKAIWNLIPRRTFAEVDQPGGVFLLRIERGPNLCLHNADGGLWAVHAMSNIAEYLRANLDVKVIG